MNVDIPRIGIAEFALRAGTQPGWSVLLVEPEHAQEVLNSLSDELQDLDEAQSVRITPDSPEDFVVAFQAADGHTVVVNGLDKFTDDDWQHIDLLRSRLARDGSTILLLSLAAVEKFFAFAPNLSSWLGSTVWRADLDANILSQNEKEQRLNAIREGATFSDHEVVARAERGELPSDPEFAEWLTLLGRGDLVPRE
jgi:hypothetical protein